MKRILKRSSVAKIAGMLVLGAFLGFAVLGMRINVFHPMGDMPECGSAGQPFMVLCPHYAMQHLEDWQHLLQFLPATTLLLILLLVTGGVLAPRFVLAIHTASQHWRLRQRLRSAIADSIRYCNRTLLFSRGIVQTRVYA